MSPLELHDGTYWVACTPEVPKRARTWPVGGVEATVYHPDAVEQDDCPTGADDHWVCPHCGADWWVEHD